jgi:hypothetical protein
MPSVSTLRLWSKRNGCFFSHSYWLTIHDHTLIYLYFEATDLLNSSSETAPLNNLLRSRYDVSSVVRKPAVLLSGYFWLEDFIAQKHSTDGNMETFYIRDVS